MNNPSAIPTQPTIPTTNLESPPINLASIFSHEFRNEIAKVFKPALNGVAELVSQLKQDIPTRLDETFDIVLGCKKILDPMEYQTNTDIDMVLETFNKLACQIRQLPNTNSFINDIDKSVVEIIMDMNALMVDYLDSHKTVALSSVIYDNIDTSIHLPNTAKSAIAAEFGWADITRIAITDTFTYEMLVEQVKKWLETHKDEYVII